MNIKPLVLDLSHYSVVRSFPQVYAAGYRGIINKATEGLTSVDKTFSIRRQPARDAGLLYGAYHFLRPGKISVQVERFLSVAKPDDRMLLALDHEDAKVPLAAVKEFLGLIHQRVGRDAILYSGFLIKEQLGTKIDPDLAKIRLWLCHYNANPSWPKTWVSPWLWQFTGDGKGPLPHSVPGIDGTGLDINSFDGTSSQLAAEWGGPMIVTVPPPPSAPIPDRPAPLPPVTPQPRPIPPLAPDMPPEHPLPRPPTPPIGVPVASGKSRMVIGIGAGLAALAAVLAKVFGWL